MNLCILIWKVISDIDFKFIINNKFYKSVSRFELELLNNSKIKVEGYTNIADFCYRYLRKNDNILIEGYLKNNNLIIITQINMIENYKKNTK